MSVIVSCPKCQRKLKIEDNVLGKNIKCPGCTAVFATKAPAGAAPPPVKTVPEPPPAPAPKKVAPPLDDNGEDEAPRRPAKAAPRDDDDDRPTKKSAAKAPRDDDDYDDDRPTKKSAAKKSRDDDYDDEDDRPKKSSKKGRDEEDEDDRPAKKSAAKKGRDDDEEDDDRPSKKAKKKGGAGKVVAIVGVIVLLLCGGCGGGAYYVYTQVVKGVKDFATGIAAEANKLPPDVEDTKGPLAKAKPASFPAAWKKFQQDKYGFSVMLPGTPATVATNNPGQSQFVLEVPPNQPKTAATKTGYHISVKDIPAIGGFDVEQANLTSEVSLGAMEMGLSGKEINKKAGTFAGKPGRAWDLQASDGVWHFRACSSGNKIYTLAAGPEAKVSAADADMFFSSFELK